MLTMKTYSNDPYYNQAFEEFIFENYTDDDIFYVWQNEPCVVVGSFQNICREVHVRKLLEHKIPVVRRISGGGTVYHDKGNINYTYITKQENAPDYESCMQSVISALRSLGINAEKNRTCDIAIDGKKISGSAQKGARGRVLHHGTLLFDSDLSAIEKITMKRKNDSMRTNCTASAICEVTNIKKHLTEEMEISDFVEKLLNHIFLDGRTEIRLSEHELKQIEKLKRDKYQSWDWTWGKTPKYNYEKLSTYDQEPIYISYKSKNGILSEVEVKSAKIDSALAMKMLESSKLHPEEIKQKCRTLVDDKWENLMDCIL